jgi:hypothetical protein
MADAAAKGRASKPPIAKKAGKVDRHLPGRTFPQAIRHLCRPKRGTELQILPKAGEKSHARSMESERADDARHSRQSDASMSTTTKRRPFRLTAPAPPENDLHADVAQALDLLLLPPSAWTTLAVGHIELTGQQGAKLARIGVKRSWPDIIVIPGGGIYGHRPAEGLAGAFAIGP